MTDAVKYQQDGHIVTLTLNEPDTRNAISDNIVQGLVNAIDRINRDIDVRCVIVTGEGKSFSAGGNVKQMRDRTGMFAEKALAAHREDYLYGIQRMPRAFQELDVPSIAAVNGHAIGAGCDLSLMCDIRIASDKAVFAESFLRLGLVPGDGGGWFLPRVVGRSRAFEMTFTSEFIDAATAAEYGLISRVVPHDELMKSANELASRIARHPPHSLRLTKRILRDSENSTLDMSLNQAASAQGLIAGTQDHREAIEAFFEKREPQYKGR